MLKNSSTIFEKGQKGGVATHPPPQHITGELPPWKDFVSDVYNTNMDISGQILGVNKDEEQPQKAQKSQQTDQEEKSEDKKKEEQDIDPKKVGVWEGQRDAVKQVVQEKQVSPVFEGKREAKVELAKEEEKSRETLQEALEKANHKLLEIKNIFPFDLFPDTVSIERNQVNVVHKIFFLSERRHSIAIKDITDVFVETSIFFATLKIIDTGFVENQIKVGFLKRNDAMKARRIIQGLVIADKENIDITKLDDDKLVEKLEELGKISS